MCVSTENSQIMWNSSLCVILANLASLALLQAQQPHAPCGGEMEKCICVLCTHVLMLYLSHQFFNNSLWENKNWGFFPQVLSWAPSKFSFPFPFFLLYLPLVVQYICWLPTNYTIRTMPLVLKVKDCIFQRNGSSTGNSGKGNFWVSRFYKDSLRFAWN